MNKALLPSPASYRLKSLPPLECGARMNAKEFLRRYERVSEDDKAELINGIVYAMPYFVSPEWHAEPDSILQTWIGTYSAHTPGVKSGTNSTLDLTPIDIVQPDGLLGVLPEYGGVCRAEKKNLKGRPELVFEIAFSSSSIDRNEKLETYRRAGVPEYLLWRTADKALDWWSLQGTEYRPIPVTAEGTIKSSVFPGLWLDTKAVFAGDSAKMLALLQRGINSTAHRKFVSELKARFQSKQK